MKNSNAAINRILWNSINIPDFILHFSFSQFAPVPAVRFSPEESHALLSLLSVILQFAVRLSAEDAFYKEVICSVFRRVLLFAPLFIENEMKRLAMSPLNFQVLHLFVALSVKVCRVTQIRDLIGEEQWQFLCDEFTDVSYHWKNEDERCLLNRLFKNLVL